MNRFERWLIRSITRRAIIHTGHHDEVIEQVLKAQRGIYYEDNVPTSVDFMRERLDRVAAREPA